MEVSAVTHHRLSLSHLKHTTTDANAHENAPEDDHSSNRETRSRRGEGLCKSGKDDDDQLETVHPLPTDDVRQVPEADLTENSSTGGSNLDSSIRALGDRAIFVWPVPVNDAEHGRHQTDCEDVVAGALSVWVLRDATISPDSRISKETDTSDGNGAHMVPSKGCLHIG